MTNRRTFLALAGAAASWMALPLDTGASTRPAGTAAAVNVEQWLLGKGRSALSAADLEFVRGQMRIRPPQR